MGLTQDQASHIWQPKGPKAVSLGNAWTSGATLNLAQNFDLSLPISGLRIVFKGRIKVATANYTSVNPAGILNMIKRIYVTGTNTRQGGNVTLVDQDLLSAFLMNCEFQPNGNLFTMNCAAAGNVSLPPPTTPFVAITATSLTSYFLGTTAGTDYDFIVAVDIPFYPHGLPTIYRPAFGVRQEEWRNSLQVRIEYGTITDNADAALGVSAATTVTTKTGYGVATGSPTVDVYSLPYGMGPDLAAAVIPGIISRVNNPLTGVLQVAGGVNTQLLILQPQDTTRVMLINGTSTTNSYFATFSDVNVSTAGINVGGNRVVRENDDIWAHKQGRIAQRGFSAGRPPIQGCLLFDFLDSGSPFGAYPGSTIGQGTLFQLVGTVAGLTNGYGIVVQEQMLWRPGGSLYGDSMGA